MSAPSTLRARFRRLARNTRGTYLVEFAIISLPLMTLLAGGVELGYMAYAKSNVEGALREVSRLAATGEATSDELDALLNRKIGAINKATVEIDRRSYASFEDVAQPEPRTNADLDPIGGDPDVGECWTDMNPNGTWDEDRGAADLGGSEDILYYGVTVTYPLIFGLTASVLNGGDANMVINANAVIKNEPFGEVDDTDPEEVCTCPMGQSWIDGACA